MLHDIIPCVSLRDLNGSAEARRKFVTGVGEGLRRSGFVFVSDHDVPKSAYEDCYDLGQKVFSLPDSLKNSYKNPHGGFTGYVKFERQSYDLPAYNRGDAETPNTIYFELGECWHVSRETYGNLWATEVPRFREILTTFFNLLDPISMAILEGVGEYLSNDPRLLLSLVENGMSTVRLMQYPVDEEKAARGEVVGAAHEDVSVLTFFSEGTASGLQVQTADGEWHDVVTENKILVGAGDMLTSLTNGYFRSGTHRVKSFPGNGRGRVTLPFFVAPRPDASVGPLAVCVAKTGRKPRFPDISAAQMLAERLRITLPDETSAEAVPPDLNLR